jgi:endoglucanase
LDERFGRALANRVIATFEDIWITEKDLDEIRALGLNVLRVPFSYRNFIDRDRKWRTDAFTQLDWIVDEAWKRGIYTIPDMHGMFQSGEWHAGKIGANWLWGDPSLQDMANTVWLEIAKRYAGHPGVAGYDYLNEPRPPSPEVLKDLYHRFYKTIRAVDPDHVIFLHAPFDTNPRFPGGAPWNLAALGDPALMGWSNVAYQTHGYGDDKTADFLTKEIKDCAKWKIPFLVGEFGLSGHQDHAIRSWDAEHINWTSWTYKIYGKSWEGALFSGSEKRPAGPNIFKDSPGTIMANYATNRGTAAAKLYLVDLLRDAFGTPVAVDDEYRAEPDKPLEIDVSHGVLANDFNRNGRAITARLEIAPTHGTLDLRADGSFTYIPGKNFSGSDIFRYRSADEHSYSGKIADVIVSIVVK